MDLSPIELAEIIVREAKLTFDGTQLAANLKSGFGLSTRSVKEVFRNLGERLDFKTAAAGCEGVTDPGEWLYDFVWYESDDADRLLLRHRMVLESEWNRGLVVQQSGHVDRDFQKLIQARADVRVWITACHNEEIAELHLVKCKHQVERFFGTEQGDIYVFIIFVWETSRTDFQIYRAIKSVTGS